MEIQSIFAWKSLPEAGFGKNVVIDAHRCSGSRIHLDHRSAGRSVIQDHSSDHRFKRLHLTRASVRRASGFVLTGYAEIMRRRTLDRWVVFGQRDVKLSISRLVGSQFRSLLIPIHQRSNRVLFPSGHGSWRFGNSYMKPGTPFSYSYQRDESSKDIFLIFDYLHHFTLSLF